MSKDRRFTRISAFIFVSLFVGSAAVGNGATPPDSLGEDALLRKELCKLLGKRQGRSAASLGTVESLREHLQKLNPWLTPAELEAKIKTCDSVFSFYRSFVSSFYDLVENGTPEHAERFAALRAHRGWIVGDAHPENFGSLLNDRGKADFTMNDLDDFSKGPLYLDILRFVSAVRNYDERIDLKPLLKAYRKGLSGEEKSAPKVIEKLLKKSEKSGLKVDSNLPPDAVALASEEREQVKQWVEKQLGSEFSFKDAYRRNRMHGGSGGLERFELILTAKGQGDLAGQVVPVELKQLTTPATFPIQTGTAPSAESRIKQGLNTILGSDASRIYRVVDFDGKKMFMRPRWKGNLNVALEDLKRKEIEKIAKHEAFLLGQFHRKSADNISSYEKAFSRFSDDTVLDESAHVADAFKEMFKELK